MERKHQLSHHNVDVNDGGFKQCGLRKVFNNKIRSVLFFIISLLVSNQFIAQSNNVSTVRFGDLEIYKKDLSTKKMTIAEAEKAVKALGKGWRLPTLLELKDIYAHKDEIGNFKDDYYWTGTKLDDSIPWYIKFWDGTPEYDYDFKYSSGMVRPVRSAK